MADDVTYPIPDGTIQGCDLIGGVYYPRAKVVWGPDGTINDTDVATGKPMPVQLRGSDGTDRSNLLPVSFAAVTPVVSSAVESSHVIKGSAGTLYDWHATTGAVAGYVMIFNATSAPADGAVTPICCFAVAALNTVTSMDKVPTTFSTGITMVFSSTGPFTKTASATAFFSAKAA